MTHYKRAMSRFNQAMVMGQLAMVIAGLQCALQIINEMNTVCSRAFQAAYEA